MSNLIEFMIPNLPPALFWKTLQIIGSILRTGLLLYLILRS
jgi:hypothetical protein